MANLPISGLTASASNAAATDVLPVVQTTGTGPVKMTVQQIAGGLLGSTSLTGATVTTSQPVLDLAQTWNASGVTFTGLKFNAAGTSDANSASASLLMDLQVGSASKFKIAKNGNVVVGSGVGSETAPVISFGAAPSYGFYLTGGAISVTVSGGEFLRFDGANGRINSYYYPFSIYNDVFLSRRGTANWRLGNADAPAPVPQTLSVQSVVAGTTNTAGADLIITGSQSTGSAFGGDILFQTSTANSGGGPTVQNTLFTALTIFANGTVQGFSNIVAGSNAYVAWSSRLLLYAPASDRLAFNGTSASFPALKQSSTTLQARLADDTAFAGFAAANVQAATAYTVATLPTPATGMIARVTDASVPVIGATVAGGGAAYALVNYNGANWTVIGV